MRQYVLAGLVAFVASVAQAQTAPGGEAASAPPAPASPVDAPRPASPTAQTPRAANKSVGVTVTNWYKQTVYGANNKVGTIEDVLISDNGQVSGWS